jgi:hypothetical protein
VDDLWKAAGALVQAESSVAPKVTGLPVSILELNFAGNHWIACGVFKCGDNPN